MSTIEEILDRALLVRHRNVPRDVVRPAAPHHDTTPPPTTPPPPTRPIDDELHALCEALVSQTPAATVTHFLTEQLPSPRSALVLACILQLADAEDGARFWWQYAAGAGHPAAAYCLYLHHQSLGEQDAAQWWQSQAGDTQPHPIQRAILDKKLGVEHPIDTSTVTLLKVLRYLAQDTTPSRSPAAEELIDYIPDAVATGYLREPDAELPLPGPGFAQRVRQLLQRAARNPTPARRRLPARPNPGTSTSPHSTRAPHTAYETAKEKATR